MRSPGYILYLSTKVFVYSEVNTVEVYEGCHIIDKFDEVMDEKGFKRVMTHIYHGGGWGDALYIKKNIL